MPKKKKKKKSPNFLWHVNRRRLCTRNFSFGFRSEPRARIINVVQSIRVVFSRCTRTRDEIGRVYFCSSSSGFFFFPRFFSRVRSIRGAKTSGAFARRRPFLINGPKIRIFSRTRTSSARKKRAALPSGGVVSFTSNS